MFSFDPPESSPQYPSREYDRLGADAWSDRELAAHVIETVRQPRQADTDSFLLHSPLEVLARFQLLSHLEGVMLEAARVRLLAVATQMTQYGPAIASPRTNPIPTTAARDLLASLKAAVIRGDLDAIDQAMLEVGHDITTDVLVTGAIDFVAPFTSAAGHAPIFLNLALGSGIGAASLPMLRPLFRELARNPDWRIGWIDSVKSRQTNAPLFGALASTPLLGMPGSGFIHPVLHQVDPEPARGLLASIDLHDHHGASQAITRAAALSMLTETTEHAPYGWSHCLTMPQALCRLVHYSTDPQRLLAIAATHIVGFRAAFATRPLSATYDPPKPSTPWKQALDEDPDLAAQAVWHSTDSVEQIIHELARRAATNHDTHLVKYTVACFDATVDDPDAGRLYLAAAAKLSAWWTIADRQM